MSLSLLNIFLLSLYFTSVNANNPKVHQEVCETITVPMCRDMPYSLTSMPNFMNHSKQSEATIEIEQFHALKKINCSDVLSFFLCSMYAPICLENYSGTIPACRSVCLRAQRGCFPIMRQYGFEWPEKMNCDRLPEKSQGVLCMDPNDDSMMKGAPRAPVESEAKEVMVSPQWERKKCQCQNCSVKVIRANSLVQLPDEFSSFNVSFGRVPNCVMPCHNPYEENFAEDENNLEGVLTFFSVLCLISSTASTLAIFANLKHFDYPERAMLYFNMSFAILTIGFFSRITNGHETIACEALGHSRLKYDFASPLLARHGFQTLFDEEEEKERKPNGFSICALNFIVIFYFFMLAAMWWLVMSLTWFLSAVLLWAPEALAKISYWIHIAAWGVPALELFISLTANVVEGDPLTGFCFIGSVHKKYLAMYFIIPLLVKIVIGTGFVASGIISVLKVRSLIPNKEDRKNIEDLVILLASFSFLFSVPCLVIVFVSFYEMSHEEHWKRDLLCENCLAEEGLPRSKPIFELVILKQVMFLVPGSFSVFFVLGRIIDSSSDIWEKLKMASRSKRRHFDDYERSKKVGISRKQQQQLTSDSDYTETIGGSKPELFHLANMNLMRSNPRPISNEDFDT